MASILIRQEAADTDENRDAEILGVCVAFLIISTSGLAARFISKFMRRNLLQVDDYLIIWAYVRIQGHSILINAYNSEGAYGGGNRHGNLG